MPSLTIFFNGISSTAVPSPTAPSTHLARQQCCPSISNNFKEIGTTQRCYLQQQCKREWVDSSALSQQSHSKKSAASSRNNAPKAIGSRQLYHLPTTPSMQSDRQQCDPPPNNTFKEIWRDSGAIFTQHLQSKWLDSSAICISNKHLRRQKLLSSPPPSSSDRLASACPRLALDGFGEVQQHFPRIAGGVRGKEEGRRRQRWWWWRSPGR